MTNFEKLFVHLYTKGIEHYQDSQGTLREIDAILQKDENILYSELHEAFNQVKRKMILRKYGVPMEIGEPVEPKDYPPDLLEQLLSEAIDKNKLKRLIKKQASDRYN